MRRTLDYIDVTILLLSFICMTSFPFLNSIACLNCTKILQFTVFKSHNGSNWSHSWLRRALCCSQRLCHHTAHTYHRNQVNLDFKGCVILASECCAIDAFRSTNHSSTIWQRSLQGTVVIRLEFKFSAYWLFVTYVLAISWWFQQLQQFQDQ